MAIRRKGVSLETIRRVNQNMIEGKSSLDNSNIPEHIKNAIRSRHYSAEEMNAAYARVIARREATS